MKASGIFLVIERRARAMTIALVLLLEAFVCRRMNGRLNEERVWNIARSALRLIIPALSEAVVLAIVLTVFNSRAVAGNVSVSSSTSLQQSLDAASVGDTLFIPAGTYTGNLVLRKRITILGIDSPVIRGEGTGSVIAVQADSCVISGLIVMHSGTMLVEEDAGILLKSSHNVVERNVLRDVLFGIYLLHAEDNAVINNVIVGRPELELGERGSGMHIWNSQRNRFAGNVITGVRDGFYIQNANHTWIEGNESYNLRYGLHYMYADSNTFLNNSFHDNVAGAAIMYSTGIRMRGNVFTRNRGFASFGILFQDCHKLQADSNVVSDNVVGMFFEASTDNIFRHNVIAGNDIALQMFQNSTKNTFTENNFIDNLTPLTIVGKHTGSSWSVGGRGNYWSSYDGYDLDDDGIGDVPMKIQNVFQFIEGQNANVRLYLYSPASQALSIAAQAFPIININDEADGHPLMRPIDLHAIAAAPTLRTTEFKRATSNGITHLAWLAFPLAGTVAMGLAYRQLSKRKW